MSCDLSTNIGRVDAGQQLATGIARVWIVFRGLVAQTPMVAALATEAEIDGGEPVERARRQAAQNCAQIVGVGRMMHAAALVARRDRELLDIDGWRHIVAAVLFAQALLDLALLADVVARGVGFVLLQLRLRHMRR